MVIHRKDNGGESDPKDHEDNSPGQFPFPGCDQKNKKDEWRNKMDQKTSDLLPESKFRGKRIQGEQADEQDRQDA